MVTAVPKSNEYSKRQPSSDFNGPRPKSRDVTSRYLSTSSSSSSSSTSSSDYTIASPMPLQNSGLIRRSHSVDRRRPTTPVTKEMSTAAKLLLTSKRSLSVSFQGDSVSFPVSKAKPAPIVNNLTSVRRVTPERRKPGLELVKNRTENVKPSDQQRWPGRLKAVNSSFLTRSLDCGNEKPKFGSRSVIRSLSKSMMDEKNIVKIEGKLKPHQCDRIVNSDSESVSSGSTNLGVHEGGNVAQGRGNSPCIVMPARCGRGAEPGSPVSRYGGLKTVAHSKQMSDRRILIDSHALSPRSMPASRGLVSPLRAGARPASPSKSVVLSTDNLSRSMQSPTRTRNGVMSTPSTNSLTRGTPSPTRIRNGVTGPSTNSLSRGMQSPTRIRNRVTVTPSADYLSRGMPSPTRTRNGVTGTVSNNACIKPSILSFAVDARRGKVGENRIDDAYELRLMYNRQLQWRFINARAEAALMAQIETSERNLYNAWLATSKLRQSVKSRRIQLQLLQQNVKLYYILKGQVPSLENWGLIDGDHCNCMSGAICALKASIVCLPVVAGAMAEVQNVKDAMSSAVDVMQAMASSICSSLSEVEQVDLLVYELANVAGNERVLLDQCKDLLSALTSVQVKDFSLRTQFLQLKRVVSCSAMEV